MAAKTGGAPANVRSRFGPRFGTRLGRWRTRLRGYCGGLRGGRYARGGGPAAEALTPATSTIRCGAQERARETNVDTGILTSLPCLWAASRRPEGGEGGVDGGGKLVRASLRGGDSGLGFGRKGWMRWWRLYMRRRWPWRLGPGGVWEARGARRGRGTDSTYSSKPESDIDDAQNIHARGIASKGKMVTGIASG